MRRPVNGKWGMWFLSGLFVVTWSSGFIGAKYGLSDAGTFTLLFWRYLIVAIVLVVLATALGSWRRLSIGALLQHAMIGVLAHAVWLVCVLVALDLGVSPGIAAFVTALQPLVTGFLAGLLAREHLVQRQWLGVLVGIGAVGVAVSGQIAVGGSIFAHVLPFGAVMAISLATVIDRRMRTVHGERADAPILMTTSIHAVASLIVLTPFAWLFEGFAANFGSSLVFAVLWLALVVSLAAYGLMFLLLRSMETTKVSSLVYLSPPVTMLISYLTFGGGVGSADIAGLLLGVVAVAMVTVAPASRQEPKAVEVSPGGALSGAPDRHLSTAATTAKVGPIDSEARNG